MPVKRSLSVLLFALSFYSAFSSPSWAQDDPLDRLSPEHRKWLEEEVVYIILDREREVFLSLETVQEREAFIEAFWKKRDPNPATPENEFKVEHYRRITYANQFLGRETFLPGWKTDRGRMYIILGEPIEIQRFDDYNDILPAHLWFYQGDPAKGLPSFFYLLFYKRNDVGEYRLYRPVVDGPNELVRGVAGQGARPEQALAVLRDVNVELARASLSLDPAEPADMENARPSLGNEVMLARIYDSPKRAVRTDYADAWLEYGDRVSAEYSFNFVPSRSVFVVLYGPEGTPFVHYSVEIDPQNFSMEADEAQTKVYTTLDVSVEARDREGHLVLANDREAYIELTQGQVEQIKASPFAYQADFPLLPGEYKISVILRNRVLAQYTVAEKDVVVRPPTVPAMSDMVLGYSVDAMRGTAASAQELRAFQIGDARVHPVADGAFALGETAHVFLQVQGAAPGSRLRFSFLNGDDVLDERTTEISSYLGGPIIERFPLRGMVGGRYQYRVQLLDPSGQVIDERTADCQVSPRAALARPWVNRTSFNTASPGLLALARGDQLLAKKRFPDARAEYERAVAESGEALPVARWQLALVSLQMGEASRALELLTPLEPNFPNQFEVVVGLGFAHGLQGDCSKAVGYLEKAMTLRPPDTALLNVLGGCYQAQGNVQKASEMLERSLKLNPEQPEIKERLESFNQRGN
jgi:GWxTD domain-containing protein